MSGRNFRAKAFSLHSRSGRRFATQRRHGEIKCRTAVRVVLRPKPAPVRFDNRPTNGKSHPKSVALSSVERLENFGELVARQTGAAISDRDLYRAGAIFRPHYDFAFPRGRVPHGVKSVN